MLDLALKIATEAHKGQVDKAGVAYIEHPKFVANLVNTEEEKIVALLHYVIEDTTVTLQDLKKYGFSKEVIEAIILLTKNKTVKYSEYIRNIKLNKIARIVKIADLKHNSDISRLSSITQKDLDRLKKYKEALRILEN